MKPDDILDAIGSIDERTLVSARESVSPAAGQRRIIRWCSAAAACLILAVSTPVLLKYLSPSDPAANPSETDIDFNGGILDEGEGEGSLSGDYIKVNLSESEWIITNQAQISNAYLIIDTITGSGSDKPYDEPLTPGNPGLEGPGYNDSDNETGTDCEIDTMGQLGFLANADSVKFDIMSPSFSTEMGSYEIKGNVLIDLKYNQSYNITNDERMALISSFIKIKN